MSTNELLGNITVKQEKLDSENVKLERVTKSSSEILTELFGVFNAKPPEIEESAVKYKKSKKSKKKHKKEKKKKKSKRHGESDTPDSDDSPYKLKRHKKEKKEKSKKRHHLRDEISLTPPRRSSSSPSRKRHKRHSFDDAGKRSVKIDPDSLLVISKENVRHKETSTKEKLYLSKLKNEVKEETIDIPVPSEADVSTIKLPEEKLEIQKAVADSTTHQESSDKSGKGKIQIKNLKFSSVFKATVKLAEEEAKKKAELYEDGEISDTSFSSEPGNEPDNNPEFPKSRDPGGILQGDLRDIILSKEEKRASERKRSRSRDKKKTSERSHHSSDKVSSSSKSRKRSRSKSRSRRRSRSRERESKRSDSRSRHRSHRSRSRRRSTSKTRHSRRVHSRSPASNGVKLADTEKRRLLEVARRNALSMLRKGTAPLSHQQANQKLLAAIKSGGKSVDELTDFCKHLSKKEALGELSSLSSGDSELGSDNEDTIAFHHPFLVKDKGPIIMNIRGGVALPVKPSGPLALLGAHNKEELVHQFPVSSGNEHRVKASEWRPVTPPPSKPPAVIKPKKPEVSHKEIEKKLPAVLVSAPAPQPVPGVSAVVPLPLEPPPTFGTLVSTDTLVTSGTIAASGTPVAPPLPGTPALAGFTAGAGTLPYYNMAPVYGGAPNYPLSSVPTTTTVTVPAVTPGPQAYPPGITPPQDTQVVDIGSIVSQRLSAIRKLQETCMMNESRVNNPSQMGWRNSDSNIGQFKGSTGAQILSPRELARGSQAWAKKDQLQRAAPVLGGMGMHLLQKMGWQPGQGLGKEGNGSLQPLLLEVKLDTKGLVAKEELKPLRPNRRGGSGGGPASRAPAPSSALAGGKHPVSLLGEYCSKHKHGAPEYTLCFECGPDHKKNFLFKVKVGGVEYQPSIASANKKQAKSDAAQIALQKLGIMT